MRRLRKDIPTRIPTNDGSSVHECKSESTARHLIASAGIKAAPVFADGVVRYGNRAHYSEVRRDGMGDPVYRVVIEADPAPRPVQILTAVSAVACAAIVLGHFVAGVLFLSAPLV